MSNVKRQLYDVAINGQGFVLAQEPNQPSIVGKQNQIFSQRIAQGDKTYNDFMSWWYMVQTDWYPGFKDLVSFGDSDSISDGHYYFASNIDAITQPGAIQLPLHPSTSLTISGPPDITCGVSGTVGGTNTQFVGTDAQNVANGGVFKNTAGVWTNIAPSYANTVILNQLNVRDNLLFGHAQGGGTFIVATSNGSSTWTDQTAVIGNGSTPVSWAVTESPCAVATLEGGYYAFITNVVNGKWGLVKTTVAAPSTIADWGGNGGALLNYSSQVYFPISCAEYKGNIYYLMNSGELRVYSPANAQDSSVRMFSNFSLVNTPNGSANLLLNANGLLFISLQSEVWTYDGTNLIRIYFVDPFKSTLTQDAYAYLVNGLVANNNNVYSGNLIIVDESQNGGSNTALHNWMKDPADTTGGVFIPLFADNSKNIWGIDNIAPGKLYQMPFTGSSYKGTGGANYVVFNNFDLVSGIDKLAYSVTFVFKTLVTGQEIDWEYLLNELTPSASWTALGGASFSNDGAVTTKTLYFGTNVIFKKIWFRAKFNTGGANTPVLFDGPILAFLPMPDYKMYWNFTVKCQNKLNRKDGSVEPKDALWLRNFLQNAWLTKSVLTFEDYDSSAVDYIADNPLSISNTTINVVGNTDNFPEFGRLLIDTEEIFYSGKTKLVFLNCTRGARNSNAATHAINTAITMSRRVIIRDYTENLILANEPLNVEYHVSLALQEV